MSQNVSVSNANCRIENQVNSLQLNQCTYSSYNSRTFITYRGSSQHTRHCAKLINVVSVSSSQSVTISERTKVTNVFSPLSSFMWGEREGTLFTDDINEAYEKIVFWRKNLFMLSTGNAGKNISKKVTRLLKGWTQDTLLRSISLKAIHTMPALQKTSGTSKI